MKYSDLHCHNHMRAYFHLQERRKEFEKNDMYTPWTVISSNQKSERKAGMAAAYSQTDLVKCWNSGMRLTFNSLYPIEKGFFLSPDFPSEGKNRFLRHIVRIATHHDLPIRDLLQAVYMRIPDETIQKVKSPEYSYWTALQEEVDFLMQSDGKLTKNKIHTPGLIRQIFESERNRRRKFAESLEATGIYYIPKNSKQLNDSLDQNAITMIMTIEGAHALGTDEADLDTLLRRVSYIKEKWPFPIFFITYAHHFDNTLCGHAHSIPDLGKWLLNQDENKNKGFTPKGWVVIRKFLSLDKQLNKKTSDGYRILIDVKHMSATSRQEYYNEIVKPCLEKGDKIPVIASHCGYSGRRTLKEHIEHQEYEKDDYFDDRFQKFNAWNINMCDEDILMIFKTEGMFGLSFDQRIVGLTKKDKGFFSNNNIIALWNNLAQIVKVIYENSEIPDEKKKNIWKMIMIGTDFEGLIDPVDKYATVLHFHDFRQDLIDSIKYDLVKYDSPKHLDHLKNDKMIVDLVDDICFNNARNFVIKNYPK